MASQAQKRSASEQQDVLDNVKAVLVDIEGTTTPISFVHDKLFGYVKDNLKEYLTTRWDNEEVQSDVDALRKQAASDKEASVEGVVEIAAKEEEDKEKAVQSVVDNVLWQMGNDRKVSGLKQLQGHMFREAYKTGKVQGEVYEDVVAGLKQLTKAGKKVFVYSSGSVESQKLLFGYSDKGDLQEYFSGYFDTKMGSKVEKDSYTAIVAEMECEAGEVLFLTDLPREAAAASEAGLKVNVVVRDGNTALSDEEQAAYSTISSFAELFSADEPAAKRAAPDADGSNGAGDAAEDTAAAAADDDDDDDLGEVDDDDVVDEEDDEEAGEEAS